MNRTLFIFWCVLLVSSVLAGGGMRNRNDGDDGDEDEDICSRLKTERQEEDEREGRTWPSEGGDGEGGEGGQGGRRQNGLEGGDGGWRENGGEGGEGGRRQNGGEGGEGGRRQNGGEGGEGGRRQNGGEGGEGGRRQNGGEGGEGGLRQDGGEGGEGFRRQNGGEGGEGGRRQNGGEGGEGGRRQRDGEMAERDINEDLLDLLKEDEPPRCGNGKSCLSGISDCRANGKCACKARYAWGSPNFACYKENELGAEVKNDPLLVTFGQESTRFPFPCRYMITHVKQKLKDQHGNRIGTCEFEVYGYNSRKLGKFFVLGFDVAAKLKYNSGKVVELSSRNYGLGKDKKLTIFNSGTTDAFSPNGPWQRNKIEYKDAGNGIFVNLKGRPNNKQIEYEVENCGFRITFVPYDVIKKRRQVTVPGISVAVKSNYNLEFLGENKAMNLAPAWGDNGYLEGQRLQGLDDEKSMLVRAFTRDVAQNQPAGASEQCEAVGTSIGKCTKQERAAAINSCFWILDQPRFMRCFDRSHNSKRLLKLFNKCIDIFCNNGSCQDVQEAISTRGCDDVPDIRPLRLFMRGDMCPQ